MRIPARSAALVAAAICLTACSATQTPAPVAETSAPTAPISRIAPPFAGLETNDAIVALIKDDEGLRLDAYRSPEGVWRIGYGHGGEDVAGGQRITAEQADALLRADLVAVEALVKRHVTAPMNADELSAMVDLAYTIGEGNFRTSTVVRELNAGNRTAAADAFLLWDKVTLGGELVVSPVLAERRKRERAMFLGEVAPTPET